MKLYKFVVLGFGHIGSRHAEVIAANPETDLVGVIDVDTSKETEVEKLDVPFFTSIQSFIDSEIQADVINICTPNGLHAKQAVKCLHNGFHVVIEKPVALSCEEGNLIETAMKKSGKQVFCVMQNRFSPPVAWLKNIVKSGRLGRVFFIQVNCFWNRDQRYYTPGTWRGTLEMDGGVLFTQFSHFVDLLVWLFGEFNVKHADFSNFNHKHLTEFEDSGSFVLSNMEGTTVNFSFSTSVPLQNLESSITIIAENACIKLGGQYMNSLEQVIGQGIEKPELETTNPPNNYGPYSGSAFNHSYIINNVVNVLSGEETVSTPLEDGLRVVRLIESVYKYRIIGGSA